MAIVSLPPLKIAESLWYYWW